ncbi:MAG TPA: hypothetical protein VG273_02770 [Bryobacteraceae bacterium]|jgi:hypothetical protein|nr:hypothetical protein [Bryobacteraceae bacterium]
MRAAVIVATVLSAVLAVGYLLPGIIELEMLHFHLSPWACVLFGDLTGCYLLASFDFKKTALAVYGIATATEVIASLWKHVPVERLVWMTDLAPTLILMALVLPTLRIIIEEPAGRSSKRRPV